MKIKKVLTAPQYINAKYLGLEYFLLYKMNKNIHFYLMKTFGIHLSVYICNVNFN